MPGGTESKAEGATPEELPRLSLRQAEDKLLDIRGSDRRPDATVSQASLRHPYQNPESIFAEDVYVAEVKHCMAKGKGNPNRNYLATTMSKIARDRLASKYNAKAKHESQLILHTYLLDVTDGNRETRMVAPDSAVGMVRLSMAWILALRDGSVVLDGGRISKSDHHWYGLADFFRIADSEKTLRKMAEQIATEILKETAIRSNQSFLLCQ